LNLNHNEDVGWLHIQDSQREAENRRLIGFKPKASPRSIFRRLFGQRSPAPGAASAPRKLA
jgi:hypothetical protein